MKEDSEIWNTEINGNDDPALSNLIDAVLIATILDSSHKFATGKA